MRARVDTTRQKSEPAAFKKASFRGREKNSPNYQDKKNKPKAEPAQALARFFRDRTLSANRHFCAALEKYKVITAANQNNPGFSITISPKETGEEISQAHRNLILQALGFSFNQTPLTVSAKPKTLIGRYGWELRVRVTKADSNEIHIVAGLPATSS